MGEKEKEGTRQVPPLLMASVGRTVGADDKNNDKDDADDELERRQVEEDEVEE